jgi:hypothetical protein
LERLRGAKSRCAGDARSNLCHENTCQKIKEKDRFSAATVADQPVHTRGGAFHALFPAETEGECSAIIG